MSATDESFARRLLVLRKQKGWSQPKLSQKLGPKPRQQITQLMIDTFVEAQQLKQKVNAN